MEPKHIVCHYGELSLKGKNRDFFEKQLVFNIKNIFNKEFPGSISEVRKLYGRILIKLNEKGGKDIEKVTETLKKVFGIANFSFAIKESQDIEKIKKACLNKFENIDFDKFRITTKRAEKAFPLTSEEVNKDVGAFIVKKMRKKVSLKEFDANCFIDIADKYAFIYTKKIKGPGGMPVGTSGKAMILMSGGLDSPVAAYYALKRGLSTRFIHFHSIPYTSKQSVNKVKRLVERLGKFGSNKTMYLVPFAKAQKEIVSKCPEKLRVILYRRMMMRITEKIAKKEGASVLITGDSLAQVASQTVDNISAVSSSTDMLILRPLIGMDKEEIMAKARDIGTYDISIEPHDDCCSRLMPKKPETRAKMEEVLKAEEKLDMENIIKNSISEAKCVQI